MPLLRGIKMGLYDGVLEQAETRALQIKATISDEEKKKIECRQALQSYLEKMFADKRLEKLVFNEGYDIELFRAADVEIDAKGTKATVVYGLTSVGAYRKIESANLFQNIFFYRWEHGNSAFSLAFALADDSNAKFVPECLDKVINSYLQEKAAARATQ